MVRIMELGDRREKWLRAGVRESGNHGLASQVFLLNIWVFGGGCFITIEKSLLLKVWPID